MRLRKLICLGLALVMVTSAVSCGGAAGADSRASSAAAEPAAQAEAEPGGEETTAAEGAEETAETKAVGETGADTAAADAAAGEEIQPGDVSVAWDDSRIYGDLTLGKYDKVTTYGVKGYEDVPFIMASDYLNFLCEGKQKISVENGVMNIAVNGTNAQLDPAADTITFENPALFRSEGDMPGAIVSKPEYNVITPSAKNMSVQTAVVPLTIDLKAYHMPVIAYEDDILMPFLALQNTFGSVRMSTLLAYNGKDYFNVFEAEQFATDDRNVGAKDSPYVKAIYSGPFSQKTKTPQAYADYGYYSICLLLDLTFGHKEEKNITTFDEYFTRLNAKNSMCSTDPSAALTAEFMLFQYLFDSGHDAVFAMDTVFGKVEPSPEAAGSLADDIKNSEEGSKLFDEAQQGAEELNGIEPEEEGTLPAEVILGALFEKGLKVPEVLPLYLWTIFFDRIKPADYGDRRLDYANDTAVIYFHSFDDDVLDRKPSYYLDPLREEDEESSTFAFFYNCFADIQQHDEVKNVVINLCDNGGGAANALIAALGFLSEDGEVKFTDRDLMAGNYREECYHVDTNLDGVADDQDGFGGQYDFYIMCTGDSYSCANALPYFAQRDGLAKVIGTNPGGGDCVVGSFVDAYGRCAAYSGMFKLGTEENGTFTSDEKATTVDLNLMPSILDAPGAPWYDPEGIADAVHQYQNGVTEISYSENGEAMVSDLLMRLFSSMGGESVSGSTEAAAEEAAN